MSARKRLLVLGAGRHQVGLIRRAEERGIEVVALDYYSDAPGKKYATHTSDGSAIDFDSALREAQLYGVAGVVTVGTDMPVLTMALVADRLGLPAYLTPDGAMKATNKLAMADALRSAGARRPRSIRVTDQSAALMEAGSLRLPLVVKPSDSQGQRATTRVDTNSDLASAVGAALRESRSGEAVIEEFVEGNEITVSAWVDNGIPSVLIVADRITYSPPPAIGIAFQHVVPSVAAGAVLPEIRRQMNAVVAAYGMKEGPLYVQMMVSGSDVYVVEAAARVGGGHEEALIPLMAGVNIIDRMIDVAIGARAQPASGEDRFHSSRRHALVNFLFARAGTVYRSKGMHELLASDAVIEGRFYVREGDRVPGMVNSLGRAGYFVSTADSRKALLTRARRCYGVLSLVSTDGEEMLFWPESHLPPWLPE